jgi:2-keto-4-pentenoate hydratase/2-oxohepta-3-ene-1,7-dioic acid hydratase in catechol pathway
VCLILDQTAETILRRNPRFLTRSKNFPTFLSAGPDLITLDEALAPFDGGLQRVVVETRLNGELVRANKVANMMFPPDYLVAFHSQVMPLFPGDVISTGTPGAVALRPGDIAECRIPFLGELRNPVVAADDPVARAQLGALLA